MRDLARAGALALAALSIVACGARNGLLSDEPAGDGGAEDSARPDVGRRDTAVPDSAPRDSARPDAGTEACRLEVVAGPIQNGFSPFDETADRPQAERRAGAYYLLHNMRAADGSLTPYGNPVDDTLSPYGGLSSAVYGATEPYVTAANEDRLGYCFDTRAGITVVGDPSPPLEPGSPATRISYSFGGHCHDLATNGRDWFVGFTSGLGPRGEEPLFMLTTPNLMGLETMPAPAFPETFQPERELRVTALPDGIYAYTAQPTFDRLLEVGLVAPDESRTFVLEEFFPSVAPPAIAPWPFDDELIAIAHHFPEGVRVVVITRDGDEILRTEPLSFSMGGEPSPALAALPGGGLVVATLNYGDFDPTGGFLSIHLVDGRGEAREVFSQPTRRATLTEGGIDAVADGNRALIHWADTTYMTTAGGPRTQALLLECLDR